MAILLSACATTQVGAAKPDSLSNRREVQQFVGLYTLPTGRAWYITYGAEAELSAFNASGFGGFVINRKRGDEFTASIDGEKQTLVAKRDTIGNVTGFQIVPAVGETLTISKVEVMRQAREIVYFSHGVALAGTVYSPSGSAASRPAVVIVHGSGYSDRDSPWYQKLAFFIADQGYVVLLPDKRGSGHSGGDWTQADFGILADDALAGLAALRTDPGVDPRRTGLVGMSQGGWIVPLAAARSNDVKFIVDLSGTSVRPEEQVLHEVTNTMRERKMDEVQIQQVLALHQLMFAYARTGDAAAAQAYVREYDRLATTTPIVKEFPRDVSDPKVQWWRKVFGYEPMNDWRRVNHPSLVIYGADDEHENVPVGDSLSRFKTLGDPRWLEVDVVEGTGHTLGAADGSDFHPRMREILARWLRTEASAGA